MTIRQLPTEVADAIAAGEVIERPASVVKELVENSIDAGARSISIEVRGAGRNLIRVADDGAGIAAGELALAFTRHATSKVASLQDLDAITSLGFRGEALASIAAVADVECSSSGARIRVRAGTIVEQAGAARLSGTVFEVRDLFSNTPARLKFLKSASTEDAAMARVVASYAICHPAVRFQLSMNGRSAITTPGDGRLRHAVAAVLGKSSEAELVEAEWQGEVAEGELAVRGVVSQPRLSRGSRDGILLSVNQRPISSRSLAFALEECYRGSLERGRHPIAALDVVLDPAGVDVNVHPAKREVKFREEGAVFAALQRAVRSALSQSRPFELRVVAAAPPGGEANLHQMTLHQPGPLQPGSQPAASQAPASLLRPVGQVQDGYLVAEGPDGLVLVDQHAAHERILFNRFMARLAGAGSMSQPLLLPQVVDVAAPALLRVGEQRRALEALGFQVEEFGPGSVRVLAAPVETPAARVGEALQEMLAILSREREPDARDRAIASLACHSAVRFGDSLDPVEQRRLLDELGSTEPSLTCPHGRPTRLVVDWQQLKRHFRRNY